MGKQLKKRQNPQQKAQAKAPAKDFVQVPLPLEDRPVLLSVVQTCELLGGISRTTLYRLDKSGALAGCRVDLAGAVRYHRQALIQWINSQVCRTE